MTKKKSVPSNTYFPEGLPYLRETQEMSRNAEQSSDHKCTGSKRSLTNSRGSSVQSDEMDDDTLTKDDETCDIGDSVLYTEDDDDDDEYYDEDDDTQEDTGTNGSDDETDTCLMSIDEHLARRHAKWFALRFGRELKLCSTEGSEFERGKTERNKKSQIDDDRAVHGYCDADNGFCSDDDESPSEDKTYAKSEHDYASDMNTKTFKIENDTLETKTLKNKNGTRTGKSRSFTSMKSETSTKSETATTRSETATKSETTEVERGVKSLANSNGSSRQKPAVKTPPPPRESEVAVQRKVSPGHETQNSDKNKMGKKKRKKSLTVAVAAATDKSYRVYPNDDRKLYNVSQLSIVDIASSNRDISVVEPLKKRDAKQAFTVRDVPHEIPAHAFLRDDISSIAPPLRSLYNNAGLTSNGSIIHHVRNAVRTNVLTRSRSQDVEQGTGSDPSGVGNQSIEKEQVRSFWCLQRRGNDLELFFIGLISISLLVLVILLIVIVSRH
jgi:hypothetical protein